MLLMFLMFTVFNNKSQTIFQLNKSKILFTDCSTEKIYEVLKQAQQIGMMSDYHSYLITSLVSITA